MLRYDFGTYRPAGFPLSRPALGQTAGTRAAVGLSSILVTALGAGTAYVGLRAGERERGGRKFLGYSVAAFGVLVALSGIGAVLGSIVYPDKIA